MSDEHWAPGTSQAPEMIGEGCIRRYDPQQLSDEHGTSFEQAQALWLQLHERKTDDASE